MLIKDKIIQTIICFFILIFFTVNISAEEFNIEAKEIAIDEKNNILVGKGSVKVTDSDGNIIEGQKVTYEKSKEFLLIEDEVKIYNVDGNTLETDRASYDKLKDLIITYKNSELYLNNGYKVKSNIIRYNILNKIVNSDDNSIFSDEEGNVVKVSMFEYDLEKNLFSSIGDIEIIDIKKNKYFFNELYVDTEKREMIGSDVSVVLDQENFGVSSENDPRFVANNIYMSKNKSDLSKAVFTVCKQKGDQCPAWSLKAKKITHDKAKKTVYYDHATLRVFDVPIFYFPKFFHPDPTVKRQSGFLTPFFTDTSALGAGFALPYFWAISNDKDLTFTPKIYSNENPLFLNEYRQAYRNAFLILDTSYTQGYKTSTSTKTEGSRNHLFADLDINFSELKAYESSLSVKLQRTSNDTYFRIHDINTALVDSENTNLQNEINYNFINNDMYFNLSASMYENLREKTNTKYEYVLPNIVYGKSFFTEQFGILDIKSNFYYKNYQTNKHNTILNNDLIWSPSSYISAGGFVNTLKGMISNTNYEAENTDDYKTEGAVNELSGVLSFKSSLPMKKESSNHYNIFSPSFMVRYAPGHMRDLSNEGILLKYTNLFSTNKTSVIEDGLSGILGFDFKHNKKLENNKNLEKLSVSLGQVFNFEENPDMPSRSSLDQKTSDIVGEINYNFSEISKIDYKFSVDQNLSDINYNEISTTLNFGKVGFNLDYLEEQNHIGRENYVNAGLSLNFDKNRLSFQTKKNFKTESTELYDISYEYTNDCLKAGLLFRREFYEDSDVEQKNSLMFKITFIPFTGVKAPVLNP